MTNINVLIVDDDNDNAKHLEEVIDNMVRHLKSQTICYQVVKVISGNSAFSEAKAYIKERQHEIDLLFIDFHLKRGLGTDLIRLITNKNYQIFTIIHSETDESFVSSQKHHKNIYDLFCKSKDSDRVTDCLKQYEIEIMDIKLFGHPKFRSTLISDSGNLTDQGKDCLNGIKIFDIVYAETNKDRNKKDYPIFHTREGKEIIPKEMHKVSLEAVQDFGFPFYRLNRYQIINLIWTAKVDLINEKIRFISLGNNKVEISIARQLPFKGQDKNYLRELAEIPDFFSK